MTLPQIRHTYPLCLDAFGWELDLDVTMKETVMFGKSRFQIFFDQNCHLLARSKFYMPEN